MANNNQTDIQLRITAAIDGLVEITKLISEVDKLGGQTTESSAEVDQLVKELDSLRQQDQLISQFQQLKKSTSDLSNTMDDARARATALGKGVADSKSAVAATNSEYKASKTSTEQLANEWQQAKAKVELLTKAVKESTTPTREQRDELKQARAEAKQFGEQYRASAKETSALEKSLNQSKSALAQQTKEFSSARKEVNQLDDKYRQQSSTLTTLRSELQQTGVNTKQLIAEQRNLKSATAQAEKEVGDLATKLREQAELQKYVAQNTDLSGKELLQYGAAASQAKTETAGLNSNVSAGGAGFVSFAKNIMATAAAFFTLDKAKDSLVSIVETGSQMEVLSKTASRAGLDFEALNSIAEKTPMQLQEVMSAAIQAKNFGLDPMTGSLQAAIDAAYAQGKSAQEVERIILALGQAYSKEKLQQEEALQLVEAGIPAWQLLAEATGKSVPELQKLATAGALGRKEIDLLISAMGSKYAGAAQSVMDSTSGLASNLADEFTRAKNEVAQSGLMDFVNSQLREAISYLKQIREDGTLTEWGNKVTSALKAIADYSSAAASAINNFSSELKLMAQIWAGLKIAGWLSSLKSLSSGFSGITAEASKSAIATDIASKSLGALNPIAKASAGVIGLLKSSLIGLGTSWGIEKILEAIDAYRQMRNAQKELEQSQRLQAQTSSDLKQRYAEISQQTGITITTMEQFDRLIQENKIHFDEATRAYKAGPEPIKQIGEAAEQADPKLVKFHTAIDDLKKKLEGLKPGSDEASKVVTDMFNEADVGSKKSVSNVIRNLDDLEKKGVITGKNISDGFGGALKKMSAEDLIQLQNSLTESGKFMDSVGEKAREAGNKLDQELFSRFGLDLQEMRNGFTEAGKEAVTVFTQIATSGKFSSDEIRSAFNNAIDSAKTETEANALIAAYQQAGQSGKVAGNDISSGMEHAKNRLKELSGVTNGTADDFSTLGMKSAATLEKMASDAEAAYSRMSTSGTTSLSQQKEAFLAWAKAELEAANASGRLPSSLIQSQAAALGLTTELAALTTQVQTVGAESIVTAGSLSQLGAAAASSSQNVGYSTNNWSKLKDSVDKTSSSVKTYRKMTPLFKAETYDAAIANDYMSMSFEKLSAEIDKNTLAFKNMQRNSTELMGPSGFSAWASAIDGQSSAVYRMRAQLGRAALDVKKLQEALAESPSETLINRAESAVRKYKELGDQNLSGLKSAIDAAKSKMDALNSSVQNTLNSLRDEMDEMNNNNAAIENRRYQTQVAELEQSLAEARAWSDTQAIANARESLKLAQQIHNQKIATINAEQAASKKTASSSSNSSTSSSSPATQTETSNKTVTVNLKTATSTTPVTLTDESQAAALLSVLEQVGLRTS